MSLPQVVQVSFQFEYTTRDGRQVSIKPEERYVLVNKSSDHWWYVRKDEDTQPFFIPAQYVTELPPENEPLPPPIDWDEQDVSNPCSEEEVISKEPTPVKSDKEKDEYTIITSVDLGQSELSKTEPSRAKAEPVPDPCNSHKDVPRVNVQQSDSKNSLSVETESPYAVSPPHFPAVSSPKTRTEPSKTANPPTDLKNDIHMHVRAGWDPKICDLQEDRLYETIGAVKDSVVQESKDNGKKEQAAPASPVPPPDTFTSSSEQLRRGSHTDMPGADKMKDVKDDSSAVYVNLPRVRVRVPSASSWGITDTADIHNTEHLDFEGWETHIDKESGKEYYFHPSTGRSTWDYPLSPSMESEVGVEELPVSPVPSQSPGYSPSVEGRWASDWEKVLDESSGRHYFFNPISGESSWDPPEDLLVPSFSDNNLSDAGPPPLPDEDYPVEEDISASPGHDDAMSFPSFANNSEYSVAHVKKALIPRACLDQNAPAGWTLSVDPDGAWVFTSLHTQEQWIKSLDDQGRTYYYLRDGSKSQWNLPELSAGLRQCQIGNGGTVEQEGFGVTRKWRHSTGSQDEKLFLSHGRNTSDSDMPSSPEMQHNVSNLEKAGILNKTRISENGKKLRKNWGQSWTVLHGGILTFHKDPKSNQTGASSKTNQIVPEFSVELKGATIGWAPKEKSSKKNVLELRSRAGTEFLIQYDTESIIIDWHKVITDTIRQLDTDQNQSDDEEEISDKFPTTEKEDRSGVDKRRMSSGNLAVASRHPSSGSVSEADQKKVRNKLRKFLLKRPTLQSVKEKGYIRENVFGCDLQNLCNQERTTVPRFVEKCIRTVEKRGLGVDGIYRVSGNLAVIQKLRFKADHAEDLDLDDGNWDIHVITGALKLFFRELQEPLFPYSHFNSFVQGIKIPDYNCRVSYITDLVKSLPAPNHDTMEVLFGHLRNVIEHGEENRMSVQNIAIVFGPTLLKPEVESTSITTYMVFQNQIIEFVLNEFETIFHM